MYKGLKTTILAALLGALVVSTNATSGCTDEDVQECTSMCSASGLAVLSVACSDNLYDCRCGSSGMVLENGDILNDPIFEELEAQGAMIEAEIAAVFDIALEFGSGPSFLGSGRDVDSQLLRGGRDSLDSTTDIEGAFEDAFMTEAEEMIDETFNSPEKGGFAILAFVPVDEQEDFGVEDGNLPIALPGLNLACMASFLSDFLLNMMQSEPDFALSDDDSLEGRSMTGVDRWTENGDDYLDLFYPGEDPYADYYYEETEEGQFFFFPDILEGDFNLSLSDYFGVEIDIYDDAYYTDLYFGDIIYYEDGDYGDITYYEDGQYEEAFFFEIDQENSQELKREKISTWRVVVAGVSFGAALAISILCLLALVGFFSKPVKNRHASVKVASSKEFAEEQSPLLKTVAVQVIPTSTKSGPEMVTSSLMTV